MNQSNQGPFKYDVVEENTGFLLWQVSHLWQQMQESILKKHVGLTQSQYVILASIHWLNLHNKEVTQAYLGRHTKIDKMRVSEILGILQKKTYVCRKAHSGDTRAKAVTLTAEGEKVMEKAIEIIESIDTEFFKLLGDDIPSFNLYLRRLIEANKDGRGNMGICIV
ncbi:MarR family winged helix-turn-helix transcriptional regulator [Dysgonomonas reticulitermitis]